ncbi:MAG: insulinase family protein [Planctomycetaceae bacterium]
MLTTLRTKAAEPVMVTSVEGISEYRLNNGLRVLLFPDPSKPQVTVNMTVLVGSRHEGYGEAGMAHLLEHMLFKGAPGHPNVPKALKDHGADFNGTTWLDRTNYYETLPASSDNLEFAIGLEADRLVGSYVYGDDLTTEMTVVRNEFESGENSPGRILLQRMFATAYEWHNYGKSTIGNRADIERVPIESLQRFYKRFYQPDNAIVTVAGQFDPKEALALIDKYFGKIPRPDRKLENTYTEEPAQDGPRQVTLRRVGDVATVGLMYHICAGPHPDYPSVDVLENILTAAPAGRLYKALVETKRAASVLGAAYALHDPGVLRLSAEVAPGNDPYDVLTTMTEVVETLAEKGVTEEEVERAKTYWMKEWELAMSNSASVAIQLSDWASQGDWRLIFLYRDRLEQVTPASVQAVAKKYLQENNRTTGIFIPTKEAERITIPQTPELASMIGDYKGREAIAQGESFDVSPESIESRTQRIKLAGGMKTALLPKKTRGEAVHLRLTLRYGDLKNLQGLTTACEALPAMMMRGTKQLTRQQIEDLLNKNRARIMPLGVAGEATFQVETRRADLPAVLDVLRQILREPTFPESEFEIRRTQMLSALEKHLNDPQMLSQKAIQQIINPYPTDDPRYVPSFPESIKRWKAVKQADLVKAYSEYLGGANGELSVVGDFDPDQIRPLLDGLFAGWQASAHYARLPKEGRIELTSKHTDINTPDKENAVYFAATVIPLSDTDSDYAPLVIGTDIFGGGGLSSRLGDRVRQEEGLSYGVGAFFTAQSLDERATLGMYAIMNPQNIDKVEAAISEELQKMLEHGVTAKELEDGRTGWLESQKTERTDDATLTRLLGSTLETGRTMQYYADLEKRIQSLTTAEIGAAWKRNINPDRIPAAVAGDMSKAKVAAESAPSGAGK